MQGFRLVGSDQAQHHVVTARGISSSILSDIYIFNRNLSKVTSNPHTMWFWGNSVKFDPDQDIGDLAEKVILVTGGMLAFRYNLRFIPC